LNRKGQRSLKGAAAWYCLLRVRMLWAQPLPESHTPNQRYCSAPGHDPRGHEVGRLPMYWLSLGNESTIGPVPVMRSARAEPSWANQGRRHRQSGDRFSDEMRAYVNPITKRLRAAPFVMVQESFHW
ncbi:uncharacterized, partial [Tachysurus ichikawai]